MIRHDWASDIEDWRTKISAFSRSDPHKRLTYECIDLLLTVAYDGLVEESVFPRVVAASQTLEKTMNSDPQREDPSIAKLYALSSCLVAMIYSVMERGRVQEASVAKRDEEIENQVEIEDRVDADDNGTVERPHLSDSFSMEVLGNVKEEVSEHAEQSYKKISERFGRRVFENDPPQPLGSEIESKNDATMQPQQSDAMIGTNEGHLEAMDMRVKVEAQEDAHEMQLRPHASNDAAVHTKRHIDELIARIKTEPEDDYEMPFQTSCDSSCGEMEKRQQNNEPDAELALRSEIDGPINLTDSDNAPTDFLKILGLSDLDLCLLALMSSPSGDLELEQICKYIEHFFPEKCPITKFYYKNLHNIIRKNSFIGDRVSTIIRKYYVLSECSSKIKKHCESRSLLEAIRIVQNKPLSSVEQTDSLPYYLRKAEEIKLNWSVFGPSNLPTRPYASTMLLPQSTEASTPASLIHNDLSGVAQDSFAPGTSLESSMIVPPYREILKICNVELCLLALMSSPTKWLNTEQICSYIDHFFPDRKRSKTLFMHAIRDTLKSSSVEKLFVSEKLFVRYDSLFAVALKFREKITNFNMTMPLLSSIRHAREKGTDIPISISASLPYYIQNTWDIVQKWEVFDFCKYAGPSLINPTSNATTSENRQHNSEAVHSKPSAVPQYLNLLNITDFELCLLALMSSPSQELELGQTCKYIEHFFPERCASKRYYQSIQEALNCYFKVRNTRNQFGKSGRNIYCMHPEFSNIVNKHIESMSLLQAIRFAQNKPLPSFEQTGLLPYYLRKGEELPLSRSVFNIPERNSLNSVVSAPGVSGAPMKNPTVLSQRPIRFDRCSFSSEPPVKKPRHESSAPVKMIIRQLSGNHLYCVVCEEHSTASNLLPSIGFDANKISLHHRGIAIDPTAVIRRIPSVVDDMRKGAVVLEAK